MHGTAQPATHAGFGMVAHQRCIGDASGGRQQQSHAGCQPHGTCVQQQKDEHGMSSGGLEGDSKTGSDSCGSGGSIGSAGREEIFLPRYGDSSRCGFGVRLSASDEAGAAASGAGGGSGSRAIHVGRCPFGPNLAARVFSRLFCTASSELACDRAGDARGEAKARDGAAFGLEDMRPHGRRFGRAAGI